MTFHDRLPAPTVDPYVCAPAQRPLSAAAWALLLTACVVSVAGQLLGYQVAQFVFGSCGTPTPEEPTHVLGQGAVLAGFAFILIGWWLAAHLTRYRPQVLGAMAVSSFVGALVVIDALTLSAWSEGWCF